MQGIMFTEEQDLLRQTARKFLSARSPSERVRELMATEAGYDESDWREIVAMGWPSLVIPAEAGGMGSAWVEQSVVFEEAGAALLCAPLLSNVMAAAALVGTGDPALGALAEGSARMTVAHGERGRITASRDGDDWLLSGRVDFVIDGSTATDVIVFANDGRQQTAFRVDRAAIDASTQPPLDLTRKLATITLDNVTVPSDACVGEVGEGSEIRDRVVQAGITMLASEQVGLAQKALAMATEYARTRFQFGRAIGSFQAVKHRLADLLVRVEAGRSVAYHAARALAADDREELSIAVPMAKSLCSEVAFQAGADLIQVHGGIGFTWEHDAHLYFKRAKASSALFGGPATHRQHLAAALGLTGASS